jgi:hypothetical protein
MLPVALALIFGLLLGFAAGYAAGGRENSPSTTTTASAPVSAPPAASAQTQPPAAGRAYSEQTVTQPRAATPPVRGDVPPVPGDSPAASSAPDAAPDPASPRPTTGRLVIRSTPSGAAVTVNGKWRGRTPLTLDSLRFGPYAIRVVQPGYTVAREDVTLSASDPMRTLSLGMQRERAATTAPSRDQPSARPPSGRAVAEPEPRRPSVTRSTFAGTIYVDSNPRGARVLIDGRPMGTTPASIPNVPIGSHVIRLELPDHRVWTTATRVAAGQQTRVTGSLERLR